MTQVTVRTSFYYSWKWLLATDLMDNSCLTLYFCILHVFLSLMVEVTEMFSVHFVVIETLISNIKFSLVLQEDKQQVPRILIQ